MTTIAREKTYKAVQFLNSVSLEVLREAEQGTRGMVLARLRAVQTPEFESIHVRRLGSANVEEIDLRVEGAAENAAASEALTTVDNRIRGALCGVLERLGGDGATAFMNGDSPEKLSDEIFSHVRELEDRALASSADPVCECSAICPPPALAEGARCHVMGPHTVHEATSKFTSGWPDRLTQKRAKP